MSEKKERKKIGARFEGCATSLKTYRRIKIRMLEEEFYIRLTDSEIDHMNSLTSELEIDAFAHKLILEKL